jgi:hypothetical protein
LYITFFRGKLNFIRDFLRNFVLKFSRKNVRK